MRRDLSTLDRDIGQDWSRIIQEAFKHGIDCDMIFGGLLAGRPVQGLYETSAIQNYLIGTKRMTPRGRVFRYAKAAGACKAKYGAKYVREEAISYTAATLGREVGDITIKCTVAITDGALGDGAIAKDELVGGYVVIYDATDAIRQHREIVANTKVAAGGGSITITLDGPLTTAVVITTNNFEVLGNPYNGLQYTNNQYNSVMGVPMLEAATGEYFWVQTWGPICTTPGSTTSDPGADAEQRQVVFDGEGSLVCMTDLGATKDQQVAGFIIQQDGAGAAGPPFIMLQISP